MQFILTQFAAAKACYNFSHKTWKTDICMIWKVTFISPGAHFLHILFADVICCDKGKLRSSDLLYDLYKLQQIHNKSK